MNILIVDDSKLLRTVLKNMLAKMGFTQVYEATNGLEAIRKMHIINPEVVFMNHIMPEMDGFEASKEILKTYSDTKLVIMSSSDFSDTPFSRTNLNIHGYIPIPFSKSKLSSLMNFRKINFEDK